MTPNRIVAFCTPLVFAPAAGAIAAWLAQHFPGIDVPSSALEEIFIAGALIALAPALQWLHGWQKYEAREAEAAIAAERLDAAPLEAGEPDLVRDDMAGDDFGLEPEPDADLDFPDPLLDGEGLAPAGR